MKLDEIIKLPEVGYRLAETHLNLVKEGPNIAAKPNPCCPIPEYKYLKAPSWESTRYCKMCHRLVIVFPQDRAGGALSDPWQVYEEPTENNPLLSLVQHNHFIDFCTMVDPYQNKKFNYPNIYSLSGDYKRYLRLLKKTGNPDLVPMYINLRNEEKRIEFNILNIISDYDKCREILEQNAPQNDKV